MPRSLLIGAVWHFHSIMSQANHVNPKDGDVLVMVGTEEGAFLLCSGVERNRWIVSGPYFRGRAIHSLAYDDRNGCNRLWMAVNSPHWGAYLSTSNDFGNSWNEPETYNIKFPRATHTAVDRICQVALGRPNEPHTLYCGVAPAALFKSTDEGETWSLVKGLFEHPHRKEWTVCAGTACLHTILPDPSNNKRMYVAISTGGVYRTDDDGETWIPRNVGVRAQFLPPGKLYPEFGQCVHKVVTHPLNTDRMFLQNHWGLYRSDDRGDSWHDIAHGVPSDFGFAMQIDPHDRNTVYVIPLESPEFRCTPEGKLRVYRTRNAGESWEPLTRGLPQQNAFETVWRDGMSDDKLGGLYFGTRNGRLFNSIDHGESWELMVEGLPAIVCVKSAVL